LQSSGPPTESSAQSGRNQGNGGEQGECPEWLGGSIIFGRHVLFAFARRLVPFNFTVTRPAEPPFPLQGRPIKAPYRRLFRPVFILQVSFTGHLTSAFTQQTIITEPASSSDKMCFGGKGDTVVIRKRERPRYSRDSYVSRPETATYRRETVTRRSGSAHRPHHHHDHHHHHDGRSRSRSRVTEERRSRTYYRD
jgi:hypothetical protein